MPIRILALLIAFAAGLVSAPMIQRMTAQPVAAQQPGCQTFPQTGYTVCGAFLKYWNAHGGLAQQGYPISSEFREVSDLDNKPYTVQYFERAVFEAHPENQPPYDVLLAQLGTYRLRQKYPGGPPTPAAGNTDWAVLAARPLKLPTVTPGRPCPIGPARSVNPAFGTALGTGPIYPVGLGVDAVLTYSSAGFTGPWGGQKVLWVGDPAYQGPALVRGHQLDGPNEVRFNEGADPPGELRLDSSAPDNSTGGWNNWPSYTRVRAPGCYAYQVDGPDFSLVIPFTAARAAGP